VRRVPAAGSDQRGHQRPASARGRGRTGHSSHRTTGEFRPARRARHPGHDHRLGYNIVYYTAITNSCVHYFLQIVYVMYCFRFIRLFLRVMEIVLLFNVTTIDPNIDIKSLI